MKNSEEHPKNQKRKNSWLKTVVLIFGLWLVLVGAAVFVPGYGVLDFLEKKMIFYPEREHYGKPERIGLPVEEVWLKTEDGIRLHAWWVGDPDQKKTILFFHGNAGNISHRVDRIRMWRSLPARFFLLEYRGFGKSHGKPSEIGLYKDALAAYRYLTGEGKVVENNLVVFGESLGGSVAIDLAGKEKVAGVILENTFTSLRDMAYLVLPIIPRFMVRQGYDNLEKIKKIHCPVLIIYGTADEVVPSAMGKQLVEAANPPKEFFEVAGAHHNDLYVVAGDRYLDRLRRFLDRLGNMLSR